MARRCERRPERKFHRGAAAPWRRSPLGEPRGTEGNRGELLRFCEKEEKEGLSHIVFIFIMRPRVPPFHALAANGREALKVLSRLPSEKAPLYWFLH
jgi:hypothetical protein